MGTTKNRANSRAWKLALSLAALSISVGFSSAAYADPAHPDGITLTPQVVPNDNLNPNALPPSGILDSGVTGIGQMVVDEGGGFVGLCTGTLINPRTVIFAAHCVNSAPANAYSASQGGVPISFGFSADNLAPTIEWLTNGHHTDTTTNIYNVNQVWYDTRSLPTTFLEGDIALATLDTPAFNIPTWTLLFSPLTSETHAEIVGYGKTGNGTNGSTVGIDFRRRAAENMLSALVSLDDLDVNLFGIPPEGLPQSLYQLDFDSPGFVGDFDFDLFDGDALPREGITAPGDSGGPLIVDQKFSRPVVVGTLDGGSTFFRGQPAGTYGSSSFYMPLFLFWDEIVANNSYVYASSRPGISSNWMDPHHWVQDMDPNYGIIRNGNLVNGLPDTPAQGVTGDTVKFGSICFVDNCVDMTQDGPGENSTGHAVFVQGGPGSVNFVPNNVNPNVVSGVQARYYDVTLSAIGETYLKNNVTVDRFTIDGPLTAIDVRSNGTLNVNGDFNAYRGFVNVDGRVNAGETLLVQGVLTGSGTFNPTFLTSVDGIIAPGSLTGIGTLRVQGDVVLASGNELLIELGRSTNDQLRVLSDPAQGTTGAIDLGGDLWLTPVVGAGGVPRAGQTYTIVLADGAVMDHFDDVNGFLGILRPHVTYGAHTVTIDLTAGKFADVLIHAPALMPFALALDQIREQHYNNLYNLYGDIDLMDVAHLERAFSSFEPASLMDTRGLVAMQDSGFTDTLQGRLSLLSRDAGPAGFQMIGEPDQVFSFAGNAGFGSSPDRAFTSMLTETTTLNVPLPQGMSAFIAGGYGDAHQSAISGNIAATPDDGLQTWRVSGGVEQRYGAFTVGIAASYSSGLSMQSGTAAQAQESLGQTALYGVYRFNNGAYLSGIAGMGFTRADTERRISTGTLNNALQGNTDGQVYMTAIEGGVNFQLADGVYFTPKMSLRQTTLRIAGFTEIGGETALSFADQTSNRLEARIGASLDGNVRLHNGWRLTPSLNAYAVGNLAGDEDGVWASFAAAPETPFYLPGAARDDFWGEIDGGLQLVRDRTSFALKVETSVGRQELHEDRYVARFGYKF